MVGGVEGVKYFTMQSGEILQLRYDGGFRGRDLPARACGWWGLWQQVGTRPSFPVITQLLTY
jgi:hypothetical protein